MKKFVFTLQKLYDVKATEEQQQRKALDMLNQKMENLQNSLNVLVDSFDKHKGEFERQCQQGIGKNELKNFNDYFNYLREQIKKQEGLIANCEKEIETCRGRLLTLINEQKKLDQMRQEQLQEYNAEMQKSFDREIEDFMQSRM